MAYYSHESLNNMIQEVEKSFLLEILFFSDNQHSGAHWKSGLS